MSDVRFNQWLHQSGTGGVSQVSGGHVGIGTTNPEIAVHSGNTKVLNVGIVTASTYYGNGANLTGLSGGGTGLDLNDNIKVRLGNSQDLQLYHDGSHSYIDDAGTGNLRLRSGTLEVTNAAGSKTSAVFNSGSSQDLYFNNTKRFETLNDGVRVNGHIYTYDNQYLKLGNSNDFLIYHNSHNYIQSEGSSQDIYIQGKRDIYIKAGDNAGGYHTSIYCDNNGGVRLSYDNVPKLYTKSHGVTIESTGSTSSDLYIAATGSGDARIYLDASNGDMSGGDYSYIKMEDGTSGSDLTIGNMQAGSIKFNVGAGAGGVGDAFEIRSNGYVDIAGASDLRLTLGSQGTAGTNDSNWLRGTGVNLYYNAASGDHLWEIGGTEHMRLANDGNLYLRSETANYVVMGSSGSATSGGATNNMNWIRGNGTNTQYNTAGGFHGFEVSGSERLRIASNGNIGINYAGSPTTENLHICAPVNTDQAGLSISEIYTGNRFGGSIKNGGANRRQLNFYGLFNSSQTLLMSLGDANTSPRLKIGLSDFDQQPNATYTGTEISGKNGDNYIRIGCHQTSGYNIQYFFNANGGVGWIQTSGSGTTYNSASDYRLKENDVAISDGITRLKQLRPIKFNWKSDSDKTLVDGFFAHEVQSVVPDAVTGTKDEMDMTDETKIWPQGLDNGKIIPLLTAALQEAITKIETLEARTAALESA